MTRYCKPSGRLCTPGCLDIRSQKSRACLTIFCAFDIKRPLPALFEQRLHFGFLDLSRLAVSDIFYGRTTTAVSQSGAFSFQVDCPSACPWRKQTFASPARWRWCRCVRMALMACIVSVKGISVGLFSKSFLQPFGEGFDIGVGLGLFALQAEIHADRITRLLAIRFRWRRRRFNRRIRVQADQQGRNQN